LYNDYEHLANLSLDYDPSQSADHHRRHEATQIEQYMSRELAPLVRRELEHRVEGTCLTIKEQLMDELEPIIQQCQAQLFQSYRQAKDIPNPTVQLEEKSEFFGFRQSQACIEDNHTFEDTAFFDLSPSLPPLSPSFVPANCLDGPMDSFYVDPGTSSISESDHIPPNIQTSSGNVSVDDHYRYDGNRHLFRPHSFGHLNSLNGGSGTGLFNHWHPDPVPFDISGNLAGSFVPTGNDVSDTHHYSVGRTTLQEGSI
jgi:hypothetical protein